ncbi:sensor histidine kinase [Pelagovum pacificum]|uniref:histidine kinase n=1 Tax=Pelagovum pacificum TaxID=2588711 RepID=A0A5C5GBF8_9RHOB|nr:ATP-binding protein [Pelagovum pacificum]QQA44760.1 two-component sensor histidine kinase [Pelagovum pacificum]TNY32132.1 two-component sensor histidine kinase [Pelagovum pacificum]
MISTPDLRTLVDAFPMPVLAIGADERVLAANKLAQTLIRNDALDRHYITALRHPEVLDVVERTLIDGETRTGRYLVAEGGQDTTWKITVAQLPHVDGRATLLTFEDITAVEQAANIRRDFVANVSHELRTPLTALLGFVETLKGPARDDAKARDRFLNIMEREAGRMARLVEDLLSLSRVEEGERLRPMTSVDLTELTDDVAEMFRPQAEQQGLRLVLTAPDERVSVPGDSNQLRQVLNNLIENAIKYGVNGEKVELTLTAPSLESSIRGQGVRLSVRDYGEGIAAHHIARLTERFYRVDVHRSREVGGTGLGLAIVKHIVNRHRGRLRIESEVGNGCRFTVILPVE